VLFVSHSVKYLLWSSCVVSTNKGKDYAAFQRAGKGLPTAKTCLSMHIIMTTRFVICLSCSVWKTWSVSVVYGAVIRTKIISNLPKNHLSSLWFFQLLKNKTYMEWICCLSLTIFNNPLLKNKKEEYGKLWKMSKRPGNKHQPMWLGVLAVCAGSWYIQNCWRMIFPLHWDWEWVWKSVGEMMLLQLQNETNVEVIKLF
jgi:hypothetical protein